MKQITIFRSRGDLGSSAWTESDPNSARLDQQCFGTNLHAKLVPILIKHTPGEIPSSSGAVQQLPNTCPKVVDKLLREVRCPYSDNSGKA